MTEKEVAIKWLRHNKHRLSITAIGKEAGIPNLVKVVNEKKDGRGYVFTLADKHLPALTAIINDIKK